MLIFSSSCKTELEKISLDDISSQEKYQDKQISKAKIFNDSVLTINQLISQYLSSNIEGKEQKSNYYYSIARLYNFINKFSFNQLYNQGSKKINNTVFYSNYYDSAYYYAERSLVLDSNNINSMLILCTTFYNERERFLIDKNEVPFSGKKDAKLWNQRLNYIINNAERFINKDTTSNKLLSRSIAEIGLNNLSMALGDDYNFSNNDINKINILINYGQLYDYVNQFNDNLIVNLNKSKINKTVIPFVGAAKEAAALSKFFNRELIKVGWETTEHSNPNDIHDRGLHNPVYYNPPTREGSDIILTLGSDKTFSVLFKPIYVVNQQIINGQWSYDPKSSEIILDKDVCATVEVYSMDMGGNVSEYYFIPKKMKCDAEKIIMDVRETNRLNYVMYLAQNRTESIDDGSYTYDILRNMSLSNEYITQYINYFK